MRISNIISQFEMAMFQSGSIRPINVSDSDVISMLRSIEPDIVESIRWMLGQNAKDDLYGQVSNEVQKVNIILDEYGPVRTYGTYNMNPQTIKDSLNDIKDKIKNDKQLGKAFRSIGHLIEEIDEMWKKLIEEDEDGFYIWLIEMINEIKEMINEIKEMIHRTDVLDLIQDLLKRISQRTRRMQVLGLYDDSKKEITLYQASIANWRFSKKYTYLEALLLVFAHEFFHAYHAEAMNYFNVNKWYDPNEQYWSSVVMESMAAYFEHRFSYSLWDRYINFRSGSGINRQMPEERVKLLTNEWSTSSVKVWPYSGAKYIRPYEGNRGGQMMQYIFNESLISWEKAVCPIEHGWNKEAGYFSQSPQNSQNTWMKLPK